MWNARLDEAQSGIKIAGRNISNLRYAGDTTLLAESEEELKSHLMKVKEKSEKVGLKLKAQKAKIMASSPITPCQIDGETMETVTDFILGGSKITADGDCSHEIKRHLLLERKGMTNLDKILKSRDITLPTKVRLIQCYGFSSSHVWMWELDSRESWALKIWCFWTVVLEKTLESPLDCKEIQLVILKEISPEYSLEGLMLKLKLRYFGHLMWMKHWLTGKDPDAGKDWRREKKEVTQDEMVGRHHRLNEPEFEQALGVGDGQGSLACCSPWGREESDTTEQMNWTELN